MKRKSERRLFQKGLSQFGAVKEGNTGIVTAAGAIIAIIKDPLFPILEEDLGKTHSAREIRRPGLDHDSSSPGFELLMKHLIPDTKISVLLNPRLSDEGFFRSSLGKVFHRW